MPTKTEVRQLQFMWQELCYPSSLALRGKLLPTDGVFLTLSISLLQNCHQKPKFGNYDFCGKNCASQAKAQGGKAAAGQRRGGGQVAGGAQGIPLPTAHQVVNACTCFRK